MVRCEMSGVGSANHQCGGGGHHYPITLEKSWPPSQPQLGMILTGCVHVMIRKHLLWRCMGVSKMSVQFISILLNLVFLWNSHSAWTVLSSIYFGLLSLHYCLEQFFITLRIVMVVTNLSILLIIVIHSVHSVCWKG